MPGAECPLGDIVATLNAPENLSADDIAIALSRHVTGDWGELDEHDRKENELALREGCRLFSVYHGKSGVRFYIITEADRNVTTILLPEDY